MARRIPPPRRPPGGRARRFPLLGALTTLVVVVTLGLPSPSPVEASSTTSTSTTSMSTTTASSTSTSTTTGPTTTMPPGSSSTTVPPPTTTIPAGDPSTSTSADTEETLPPGDEVVDDPLSDEGRSEDAPDVDPDIPPPDTYGGQGPYVAPDILWSSVAEAERKLERSREAKREAVADVRVLRLRAKHLELEQRSLDEETRLTVDDLTAALERHRARAVADYRTFGAAGSPSPAALADPSDLEREMLRRRGAHLAGAALAVGDDDLDELSELRQGLDTEALVVLDRLTLVADYLGQAELAAAAIDAEIEQAEIEYQAFSAGSEVFVTGVVFPIAGPYNRPLIDSYGFPRMTGTPDEHWHEGIDLFAPRGTPLVAAERGVIARVGVGRLGGLKLWLVGESGSEWYYAHLDSFAPGLADGLLVEAGDLLGYVGNTGNAVGTPPHLHLQLHPDGGRPVNPYPLLEVVADLDEQAMVDGIHPGWVHEPVVVNGPPAVLEPEG